MAIKVQHGEVFYIVDTPEEAVRIGTLLNRKTVNSDAGIDICATADKADATGTAWTPDLVRKFIERLGQSQQTALSVLIASQIASDEYLREAVGAADNQALAGVLSGISKQAAALGMSPRSVFSFVNLRNGGKRSNIYNISESFRENAAGLLSVKK
jgi:hypothetical protein